MYRMINVYGPAVYDTCELFAAHFTFERCHRMHAVEDEVEPGILSLSFEWLYFHSGEQSCALAESLLLCTLHIVYCHSSHSNAATSFYQLDTSLARLDHRRMAFFMQPAWLNGGTILNTASR
eukprot:2450-Heterococcus_DN1.PRE.1